MQLLKNYPELKLPKYLRRLEIIDRIQLNAASVMAPKLASEAESAVKGFGRDVRGEEAVTLASAADSDTPWVRVCLRLPWYVAGKTLMESVSKLGNIGMQELLTLCLRTGRRRS
jgi:hypothetical protein